MKIEERLSMGKVTIRIITGRDSSELLNELRDAKYIITSLGAEGRDGNVRLILTVTDRANVQEIISIVKKHNPHAFYSV